jgi:hypothetical protein
MRRVLALNQNSDFEFQGQYLLIRTPVGIVFSQTLVEAGNSFPGVGIDLAGIGALTGSLERLSNSWD